MCVGAWLATTAGPAVARTQADVTAPAPVTTTPAPAPTDPPGISVQGNQLMQNGQPFVPRGVQIVGLVAPNDQLWGKYIPANAHFGAPELAQAVADHADLVRIQVSEFGLNPADPLYSPAYVQEVQQGVELARSEGLDVIVSLQAEPPAGDEARCLLPDAGAATDWNELASMFGGDDGTMFELYNEPGIAVNFGDWQTWLNGGATTTGSGACTAVGMQSLVDEIRADGADNVIILPGLGSETSLAGVPAVTDPSNPTDPQLAYGIHYPALTLSSSAWDTAFGNLAHRAPVIVTEWQANSTTTCVPSAPTSAVLLLDYLASKQIGVVGFAFDLPGTIVSDYDTYAPTSYDGFACGVAGGGAGQILFDDFAGEAAQQSGSGLDVPRSWVVGVNTAARLTALNSTLTNGALNTPRTFVTNASSYSLSTLGLGNAVPMASFTSETALAQAARSGALQPGTRAVELVLGSASPATQQRSPLATFQSAAIEAHSAGLLLVVAPQLSLMHLLTPQTAKQNWSVAFLRRNIAASAARFADAVVLPYPAQPGSLVFAQVAAQQVKAVARSVEVLADMSVNGSPSSTLSAPHLAGTAPSTPAPLAGYNLSDGNGAGDNAVLSLLQWMYPQG